jgi:hypothetical protein
MPEGEYYAGAIPCTGQSGEIRRVSTTDLESSLWLRALSAVVQAHAADEMLDSGQIKKETNHKLAEDIAVLAR